MIKYLGITAANKGETKLLMQPSVGSPSCGCRRARCVASCVSCASESLRPSQIELDSVQGPMAVCCQTIKQHEV